jgi:hypothetical protein
LENAKKEKKRKTIEEKSKRIKRPDTTAWSVPCTAAAGTDQVGVEERPICRVT